MQFGANERRAVVTGMGMDGSKLMGLDRAGTPWRRGPRLAPDQQTGERVYARNDIDRGHMVRRPRRSGATRSPRRSRLTKTPSTTPTPHLDG
ncbi:DNA/RNA non-specific endonuclease [Arthrobacter sp. NPDC055138]